jgi:hypothetical protein
VRQRTLQEIGLMAQLIMAAGALSLNFDLIPQSFKRICPAAGDSNFRSS